MTRDLLLLLYVGAIALVGFVVAIAFLVWGHRVGLRRRLALDSRKRFEALHTDTPKRDSSTEARQRALDAIERSATVTRRLVVPLALLFVGFFAGLPFLDQVPATIFSLLVAAVTVLVGIAARPFVENAIAGLVISSSKILNIGDTVRVSGYYGTVEDITLSHTTLKLWDWRRYVVPNGAMLNRDFENYSLFDKDIWAHVEFWVAPDTDLEEVERIAIASPLESTYFNATEEPQFWVMALEKDAVHCWVAAWAKTPADAWLLVSDMRNAIAQGLRKAGIRTHKTVWENNK